MIDPYADGGAPEPPPLAFACEDHARSAALLAAIEEAYGDRPPDYAEFADYRGQALVPLQARAAGHPSLRGTTIALRLRGSAELIELHDGGWPRPGAADGLRPRARGAAARRPGHPPERDVLEALPRLHGGGRPRSGDPDPASPSRPAPSPSPAGRPPGGPLRILFAGRLERVKGVLPLLEACLEADDPGWRLTLIGGDTQTAPMAQSVRMTLELMAGGDPRVEILDPVPHEELQRALPRERPAGRPLALGVLGRRRPGGDARRPAGAWPAPVGGLREIVADGVSGWHTEGTGREPIRRALERLLADRG